MKAEEIKVLTEDQLADEVAKLKKEQFNLRFQRASGQLENTSRVRVVRRDIARILTIARQKRAGDEPKLAAAPAKPKQAEGSKPARVKPRATAKRRAPVKSRSKPNPKSRAKAKKSKK